AGDNAHGNRGSFRGRDTGVRRRVRASLLPEHGRGDDAAGVAEGAPARPVRQGGDGGEDVDRARIGGGSRRGVASGRGGGRADRRRGVRVHDGDHFFFEAEDGIRDRGGAAGEDREPGAAFGRRVHRGGRDVRDGRVPGVYEADSRE